MKEKSAKAALFTAMAVFGTVGVFRHYIAMPSAVIACLRGFLGGATLLLCCLVLRRRPRREMLKRHFGVLALSGALMGVQWILLFEAYNYTTVAAATLGYYMEPVFLLLLATAFGGERLTGRKVAVVAAALCGMVCVSGVLQEGGATVDGLIGILLAVSAAVIYAVIVFLNRRMTDVEDIDRTLVQLFAAAVAVLPYVCFTGEWGQASLDCRSVVLILILGIVHTGIFYTVYFLSLVRVSTQTAILYGYADPAVAVLLSALVLNEPLNAWTVIGAVLIFGAMIVGDRAERKEKQNAIR